MSKVVMLKRAFNQAVATGAVRFTDKEADFRVIKTFMLNYAKKYDVEISPEEVSAFIREQQKNLVDISTKFSGSGADIKIENVSVSNTPKKLTREELLKDAFDDAAANSAVKFADKVADFLVLRTAMADYLKNSSETFTLEEIETFIRQQERLWDNTVTEVEVIGADVNVTNVSSTYATEGISKEEVLKEGFSFAATSGAVRYFDQEVDFLVIKNMMKQFAKDCAIEVSDEEIVTYIKNAFAKMNDMVKDYSHN